MTSYILRRRGKYLNERYQWSNIPNAFPEWKFPAVLDLSMGFKDCPEMVGELHDGTLENAMWQEV